LVDILGNGRRSIEYEASQLSGVIRIPTPFGERDVNVSDFSKLDNGNIGIEIMQPTTGRYQSGDFRFLIEYLHDYPLSPPNVWLISPDPEETFPNLYVDGKIAYLGPNEWSIQYTSYDVGLMIRSWIYACCRWLHTNPRVWDWEEAPLNQHF
jgi:ubiquitin-protein ligase